MAANGAQPSECALAGACHGRAFQATLKGGWRAFGFATLRQRCRLEGRFTPSHPEHIHGQPWSQQVHSAKNAGVGGHGRQRQTGHGDHAGAAVDRNQRWRVQLAAQFHDEIRNQLVHFEPIGWSIEVSGVPGLAKLAARIVADVQDAGWGFRQKDLAWQTALRAELEKLAAIG